MRDPYRLKFHITPEIGWMNDPNGFTKFGDEYHIFYQANPYAPESGTKHWAHVKTKDFVNYVRLPIALNPDSAYDYQGCYSGSAIEKDGMLYLLYTGHVLDKSPKEEQCLAESRDGVTFEKFPGNPVIFHPAGMEEDFRDPYLWKKGEYYYCIIGCRHDNKGRVLLYRSVNLIQWEFVNVMLEAAAGEGTMWECPCYVECGEQDLLILSPENIRGIRHGTLYYIGKLNYETGRFDVASEGTTDYGSEFYAPQVINSGDRKLLIAWMDNWESEKKTADYMWAGALTYPREIKLEKGKLCMMPIREIEGSKRILFEREDFSVLPARNALMSIEAVVFNLKIRVSREELRKGRLTLGLREGASEGGIKIQLTDAAAYVSISEADTARSFEIPLNEAEDETLSLQILADMSSLELFFYNGRYNATCRMYISDQNQRISLTADQEMRVEKLEIKEISPILLD